MSWLLLPQKDKMEAPNGFKIQDQEKIAFARSAEPTVHELPAARARKMVVTSRLLPLKHPALDQGQLFALGLSLDATTAQLNELILTNVLGFRRGCSSPISPIPMECRLA